MTIGDTLIFSGVRWQTVRVVGIERMKPFRSMVVPEEPARARVVFTLAISGHGRPWSATEPQGFWRSFAEIDLIKGDEAAVVAFVRRFGDPAGRLGPGTQTDTASWIPSIAWLGEVAKAWEPPDADGLSSPTKDLARLRRGNRALQDVLLSRSAQEIDVTLHPAGRPGLVMRPVTLRAFMHASASSALNRGVPLRRCGYCQTWFEARRRDARFCSPSCRTFHSEQKRKGECHGERS
jgi:hypothetical protein